MGRSIMLADLFPMLLGGSVPLNLVIAAFILGGVAAEVFPRRKKWLRWAVPLACVLVMAVTETAWQLHPSEYLIVFYIWGWFAEAVLLGCAVGAVLHSIRTKVRGCKN